MKHKTKKLTLASFVLALLMLLCALCPLFRTAASASDDPAAADYPPERNVVYITQTERTAVSDHFLSDHFTNASEILLQSPFDMSEFVQTVQNAYEVGFDLIFLDLQLTLYDESTMYSLLSENSGVDIVLISTITDTEAASLSYIQFIRLFVSMGNYMKILTNERYFFDTYLKETAQKIASRYGNDVNIVIEYYIYKQYQFDYGSRAFDVFKDWLNGYGVDEFRLLIQTDDMTHNSCFLILDSDGNEDSRCFETGEDIYFYYGDEAVCGMSTLPHHTLYYYFTELYAVYPDFFAYTIIRNLGIQFGGGFSFPFDVSGMDAVITGPGDVVSSGEKGVIEQTIDMYRDRFDAILIELMKENDIIQE